ncbi:MAG: N-acetyltransferase family protein [Pseudoxanthomonas sp.]
MNLQLRAATLADIPAIQALYALEVRDGVATYEDDVPDEAQMAQRMRELLEKGFPYLVAELDGAFAGYAYACSYRSRIGYRWTVEDTVYVTPAAKGMGVGRALLAKLMQDCEALGFRQMVAVIGEPGNGASIALHEKLGFTTIGIFPGLGRKHGRWLDTVQMQCALGHGSRTIPATET